MHNNSVASDVAIRLSGDFDVTSLPKLSRLERQLSAQDCVVFDLAEVNHIDSTFLRFLRRLKDQPNKGDRSAIKLVRLSRKLRKTFEVTGLARQFDIECA